MTNSRVHSNAAQITRTFTWLVIFIVVLTGVSISLIVGYHLTKSRVQDAITLERSLKRSFIDDAPDWKQWQLNSPIDTKDTFVKVDTKIPGKPRERFYSHQAAKFLAVKTVTAPIFSAVRYKPGYGLYYRSGSSSQHIYYETWTSLNNVVHMFILILADLFFVLLVSGGLGYFMVRLLARRLNQPLADLTQAAQKINHASNVSYHEALPVPHDPTEVHELGREINTLLASLNQQVLRDHQFVSDASHELRTPLTSIQGHVSLIQRHGQQRPEIIPKSLTAIDHESHRMQELVQSLLRLSRMDHVDFQLNYVDLRPIVNDVITDNRLSFAQTIQYDFPNDPMVAYANLDSVQQILLALLSNASKYAPKETQITVSLVQTPQHVLLRVIDQGPGISDSHKAQIFERFYRVDQARSQRIPGTGLGLAIAARLADLNNGQLEVTDHHPTGAIFTLQLNTHPD